MPKRAAHPSITTLLIVLSLMVSLAGCAPHAERDRLRRAEALMESDAKAARALLDSIDASTLGGRDRADHAWLSVQADYKNYVPLTTDSLALVATAYYGTPRLKNYRAAMAWYTLGCCYTDMSRPEEAFGAYLKARHCFPTTQNRYYSLCEQNIGKCYLDRCLYDDAIESFTHSRDVSVAIGDSAQIAWCDFFMGRCYLCKYDFNIADSLFHLATTNPFAVPSIYLNTWPHEAQIAIFRDNDYERARVLSLQYIDGINNPSICGSSYLLIGDIFARSLQTDSATFYYRKAMQCDNGIYTLREAINKLLRQQLPQQNKETLFALFDTLSVLNDSLCAARNQVEVINLANDFQYQLNEANLTHHYLIIIFLCIIAALLLISWVQYQSNHHKSQYIKVNNQLKMAQIHEHEQKAELERRKAEARDYQIQYQDALSQMKEMEAKICELPTISSEKHISDIGQSRSQILERYKDIANICCCQFKNGLSWRLAAQYLHGGKSSLSQNERRVIRYDLAICFKSLFDIVAKEGKKVNFNEKAVLACSLLGMDSEEIEEILDINSSTIRVQKHRLREKLPEDLFQSLFQQQY